MDNAVLEGRFRFDQPLREVWRLFDHPEELELAEDSRSFELPHEPFQARVIRIRTD